MQGFCCIQRRGRIFQEWIIFLHHLTIVIDRGELLCPWTACVQLSGKFRKQRITSSFKIIANKSSQTVKAGQNSTLFIGGTTYKCYRFINWKYDHYCWIWRDNWCSVDFSENFRMSYLRNRLCIAIARGKTKPSGLRFSDVTHEVSQTQ